MNEVFVYWIPLPCGVREIVTPCPDGYTIYINASLDDAHQLAAYEHALRHIRGNDFEKSDVQGIEGAAHA